MQDAGMQTLEVRLLLYSALTCCQLCTISTKPRVESSSHKHCIIDGKLVVYLTQQGHLGVLNYVIDSYGFLNMDIIFMLAQLISFVGWRKVPKTFFFFLLLQALRVQYDALKTLVGNTQAQLQSTKAQLQHAETALLQAQQHTLEAESAGKAHQHDAEAAQEECRQLR